MTNLTQFKHDGLDFYIDRSTGESFCSQAGYAVMANKSQSAINKRARKISLNITQERNYIKAAEIETAVGLRTIHLLTEAFVNKYLPKDNPELTTKLLNLGVRVFMHELAGYKVTSDAVTSEPQKSDREKLELQLAPVPTLEEIDLAATMFGKRFGKSYEQRYLTQQIRKAYPRLTGETPRKDEIASLPTAQALLTPTQIAGELHWYYSSGNPDARKVNIMLEHLGYQVKVAGQWNATEKAIAANLCDRKPVDTNSKTQKDQLMWSAKIIDILKEHTTA